MDKWLRNTNMIKVIAFLLAVMLWFIRHYDTRTNIGSSTDYESSMEITNVAVQPINLNEKYSILSIEPDKVRVILKGKDLDKVNTKDYKIILDMKDAKVTGDYPLKYEGFPKGVEVQLIPATARVKLEEKITKEIPVTIQTTGKTAKGYKAGQPVVSPSRVHITIPAHLSEQIEVAQATIDLNNTSTTIKKQVPIKVYHNGKEVEGVINPAVVDVEVPVTSPNRTVPLQIKISGQPPKGFAVSSFKKNVEKITIYGPQEDIDRLEYVEGPQIDLSNFTSNRKYTLDIPLKNKLSSIDPAKVEIEVEIVPSIEKTMDNVPITIIGKNDKFITQMLNPPNGNTSVVIEGAPNQLEQLKLENIQATIDVNNLGPGKHDLQINFNIPSFLKEVTGNKKTVTVEIKEKEVKAESAPVPGEDVTNNE